MNNTMKSFWYILLVFTASSSYSQTALDGSNFYSAIDLWFNDQDDAVATIVHISDWDVSSVINMEYMFGESYVIKHTDE